MARLLRTVLIPAVFGLGLLACGSKAAQAQYGYGSPFGPLWGGIYVQDRVPQYALFPPVYYSHPVSRTYGGSPYAALPAGSPGYAVSQPVVIVNPYVGSASGPNAVASNGPQPLRIHNPFVDEKKKK